MCKQIISAFSLLLNTRSSSEAALGPIWLNNFQVKRSCGLAAGCAWRYAVHPLIALFLLVLMVFLMIHWEIPFSFEAQALSDWVFMHFFSMLNLFPGKRESKSSASAYFFTWKKIKKELLHEQLIRKCH